MPNMIQEFGAGTDEFGIYFEPGVVLRVEVRTYEIEVFTREATSDFQDSGPINSVVFPRIALRKAQNLPGEGMRIFFHKDAPLGGVPGYVRVSLARRET